MATETLRPNGVGFETAISFVFPSDTPHWDAVNEDPPDDDTTYVHTASGTYQRDLYALPTSVGAGPISQIEVFLRWRAGQFTAYDVGIKASIRTHATNYEGSEHLTTSETYANISHIWTTNPNTGSAWTWAEIDALEIGVSLWGGPAEKYVRCTQVYVVVTYTPVTEKFGSDAGAGADSLASFARPLSDTGSGTDLSLASASFISSDIGSGVDAMPSRAFLLPDTGVGSDLVTLAQALLASSDSGVGTESAISPEIGDLTSHDTGIGIDTAKLDKIVFLTDAGIGSDSLLLHTVTLVAADVGIGVDSAIQHYLITLADSGIGVDSSLPLHATLIAADNAIGADAILAFVAPPRIYRIFYVERFTGSEAYNRPFWSHSIIDTKFLDNLWREPAPFNLLSEYGLAIAHHGGFCWLSNPNGVWRASLAIQSLDLTADVLSVRQEQTGERGTLNIELRNDDSRYSTLPSPLGIGCQIDLSPGYVTSVGNEVSPGQTFILEAYEHTSGGGRAALVLLAYDRWRAIETWRARHQFRWNKVANELNVRDILAFVLSRVGLKLEVVTQSSVITGYFPDFIINPNAHGETVIRKLLSFVPDVFFIEGSKAFLVNPQSADASVYSYFSPYTAEHVIVEGRYRAGAWELNRIQVEGFDPVAGAPIIADSFAWSQIETLLDRIIQLDDKNLDTVAKVKQRGEAYLREAELESADGIIRIPVNCGQQLYDVIDITDSRAGLSVEKKRVLRLVLVYNPAKAQYEQRLALGAV